MTQTCRKPETAEHSATAGSMHNRNIHLDADQHCRAGNRQTSRARLSRVSCQQNKGF